MCKPVYKMEYANKFLPTSFNILIILRQAQDESDFIYYYMQLIFRADSNQKDATVIYHPSTIICSDGEIKVPGYDNIFFNNLLFV